MRSSSAQERRECCLECLYCKIILLDGCTIEEETLFVGSLGPHYNLLCTGAYDWPLLKSYDTRMGVYPYLEGSDGLAAHGCP